MSQLPPSVGPVPNKPAGLAVTSMVLGIVCLVMFCAWYISIPCAVIGLVLGLSASGKAARGEGGGAGMAKAGIICSIIGGALGCLILILWIVGVSFFGSRLHQIQQQIQQQQQQQQPQNAAPST